MQLRLTSFILFLNVVCALIGAFIGSVLVCVMLCIASSSLLFNLKDSLSPTKKSPVWLWAVLGVCLSLCAPAFYLSGGVAPSEWRVVTKIFALWSLLTILLLCAVRIIPNHMLLVQRVLIGGFICGSVYLFSTLM